MAIIPRGTTTSSQRLTGLGAAFLLAAFIAPAGAASFDPAAPHPCREPWAAAGNNGGKADRHRVARQAAQHCSVQKEAENRPQPQQAKTPAAR